MDVFHLAPGRLDSIARCQRYSKPLNHGADTVATGGRFAAVEMRAVYLSTTDSGASKETTTRKSRLGGSAQISTAKYPRIVFAVTIKLGRVLLCGVAYRECEVFSWMMKPGGAGADLLYRVEVMRGRDSIISQQVRRRP